MIRRPTSRSSSLSSRSNAMVVAGVGCAWTNRSRSRVPRASKLESCMTRESKVVVSRVLIGIEWIMEGLRLGEMIEMKTSIISPKVSLRANPIHDDQTPGSHGDVDSYCRTVHAAGNSAITPSRPDAIGQATRAILTFYTTGIDLLITQ